MGIGYQATDRMTIDYDLWFDPDTLIEFRGPRSNLQEDPDVVCIGAAQTFGRFVARPFPVQLSHLLNRTVLNLGRSGAGPEFYLERPALMARLERANTVIVQAMSARSVTAGKLRAQSMNNGVLSFIEGPMAGETHLAQKAYQLLRDIYGEDAFQAQVTAVQSRWVARHQELAHRITGRKILLWLSSAKPGENVDLTKSPVGVFPHFVTQGMIDAVAEMGFEPVISLLKNMAPQVLVNARTGIVEDVFDKASFPNRPDHLRALNTYYATPELHDLATRELARFFLSPDKQ